MREIDRFSMMKLFVRFIPFSQSSTRLLVHPLRQSLESQIESHSFEIDRSCPSENSSSDPNSSFLDFDDIFDGSFERGVLHAGLERGERDDGLSQSGRMLDVDVT